MLEFLFKKFDSRYDHVDGFCRGGSLCMKCFHIVSDGVCTQNGIICNQCRSMFCWFPSILSKKEKKRRLKYYQEHKNMYDYEKLYPEAIIRIKQGYETL